jgi:hypothetical protein
LGTTASGGFSFLRLRAEIFGTASRINAVHSNQSRRLDHAVDEALKDLRFECNKSRLGTDWFFAWQSRATT